MLLSLYCTIHTVGEGCSSLQKGNRKRSHESIRCCCFFRNKRLVFCFLDGMAFPLILWSCQSLLEADIVTKPDLWRELFSTCYSSLSFGIIPVITLMSQNKGSFRFIINSSQLCCFSYSASCSVAVVAMKGNWLESSTLLLMHIKPIFDHKLRKINSFSSVGNIYISLYLGSGCIYNKENKKLMGRFFSTFFTLW